MADTTLSRNGQKIMQTAQLGRELTSICKWVPLYIASTCENKTAKCDKVMATISSAEIHITCSLMNRPILFMIIMKKLDLFI